MRAVSGHGNRLSFYDWGATPFWALQKDPRMSYTLYVPQAYEEDGEEAWPLLVLVHGTERGAATYRDKFASFAERERVIVLCPLFPGGLIRPDDIDSYKLVRDGGIHFDELLLAMVAEVGKKYRIADGGFLLHGFSGGGHFAHRFFMLRPDTLSGVSIGAPGVVTLLDFDKPWIVGVGDTERRFGITIDIEQMKCIPVQCVVGSEDVETWEITIPEASPWWQPHVNDTGPDRIERLRSLARSFEAQGISVRFDLVPGVAHAGWSVLAPVEEFFSEILASRRSECGDGWRADGIRDEK